MERDLQRLIDDYLEGDLSDEQVKQLEEQLQAPAALAEFVEQSHLHRQLYDALHAASLHDAAHEEFVAKRK